MCARLDYSHGELPNSPGDNRFEFSEVGCPHRGSVSILIAVIMVLFLLIAIVRGRPRPARLFDSYSPRRASPGLARYACARGAMTAIAVASNDMPTAAKSPPAIALNGA